MSYQKSENQVLSINEIRQQLRACPNCWGISRWEGRDFPRQYDIDKGPEKEVFSRNGFIRRFVKKFLG